MASSGNLRTTCAKRRKNSSSRKPPSCATRSKNCEQKSSSSRSSSEFHFAVCGVVRKAFYRRERRGRAENAEKSLQKVKLQCARGRTLGDGALFASGWADASSVMLSCYLK